VAPGSCVAGGIAGRSSTPTGGEVDGMLAWFATNKDALIAVAALVSPIVAVIGGLIAAAVSYRAVVTGPHIQREISRDTLRTTQAQITANLYGAADHQWISDFRDVVAEAVSFGSKRFFMARIQGAPTEKVGSFDVNQRLEISLQLGLLSNKVRLMVVDKKAADELAMLIIEMGFSNELARRAELSEKILDLSRQIIGEREATLRSYSIGN
jgi:hypothetical protein